MKTLKFHRDGYDYVCNIGDTEYCVSKAYDVWCIWVNDVKQDEMFDYIKDAKEWCNKHYNKIVNIIISNNRMVDCVGDFEE